MPNNLDPKNPDKPSSNAEGGTTEKNLVDSNTLPVTKSQTNIEYKELLIVGT